MVSADPYQLLGIGRAATVDEVLSAYEHLAVIFDPDRWAETPDLAREAGAWAAALDDARREILGA